MTLKAIDLFCGAGGLTRGLVDAGFSIAGSFDSWGPAARSYTENFSHLFVNQDVSLIDRDLLKSFGISGGVDLVAGGPPCQGFSAQRIGANEDDRNELVHAFGKVVIEASARMFIMENVRGLLGRRGRETVERFTSEMEYAGYDVQYRVLDAADYGVAQSRLRVFFVGTERGSKSSFSFPQPTVERPKTVREALIGLPFPPADLSPHKDDALHRVTRLSPLNQKRIAMIPPGGGFEDLPVEMRANCHKAGATRIGHRAVYGRLHPDRPACTITGRFDSFTRGRFGHPTEPRNLTLREGARLQGFPDDHIFVGTQEEIAAQIGNAVPPPLALAMAQSASRYLRGIARKKDRPNAQLPIAAE